MIIVIYKENIITTIIGIQTEQEFIDSNILQNDEKYKAFTSTRAYKGLDIRALNNDGEIRPNSELLAENLIVLKEDEVLENEIIRKLTDDEMKHKFPDRYPVEKPDLIKEELQQVEAEVLQSVIQDRSNKFRVRD